MQCPNIFDLLVSMGLTGQKPFFSPDPTQLLFFTVTSFPNIQEVALSVEKFHESEIVLRWKGSNNYVLDLEYVVPQGQQQQSNFVEEPVI